MSSNWLIDLLQSAVFQMTDFRIKAFQKQTKLRDIKEMVSRFWGWVINDKIENYFRESVFFTKLEKLSKEKLKIIFKNNLQMAASDMVKLAKADYDEMLTKIMSVDKALQNEALDYLRKFLSSYRVSPNADQKFQEIKKLLNILIFKR